jgi:hypothetical protein
MSCAPGAGPIHGTIFRTSFERKDGLRALADLGFGLVGDELVDVVTVGVAVDFASCWGRKVAEPSVPSVVCSCGLGLVDVSAARELVMFASVLEVDVTAPLVVASPSFAVDCSADMKGGGVDGRDGGGVKRREGGGYSWDRQKRPRVRGLAGGFLNAVELSHGLFCLYHGGRHTRFSVDLWTSKQP